MKALAPKAASSLVFSLLTFVWNKWLSWQMCLEAHLGCDIAWEMQDLILKINVAVKPPTVWVSCQYLESGANTYAA